ncbi:glutamate-1-semialdehyde 2,1-aminomutase [Rossellomorea vietnamensis]|uniref:Glutamate-1-semialdehyde 2,1-aminomutase n=1 Tax=Rossellomorea vietnamensis TaxID=218284 RepID=A0A6I6ULG5_9BACI|nr:glutamate-1-semialdehyde 2,1-aminomutase [Rossellomorea vietnamensis]QHE59811.1 glutamate-1-semialdehyde 2,1-aminomutase [Rossellomorea vietnamensis]
MQNPSLTYPLGCQLADKLLNYIPGGSHAYSKSVNQWPNLSPKVLSHGEGSYVWDVDGNRYIDWFTGLSTVSLGHGFSPVIERVYEQLKKGINFQLPTKIEFEAAEYFLNVVAKDDMVKFSKDGSTVNDAAIKLSRAYTGKRYIAKCSQHPFFSYSDWFIGHSRYDQGILEESKKYTIDFNYNDISSLESLFLNYPNDIAAVILEPVRFEEPQKGFLQDVRKLCNDYGAVLIFDEVVTGLKYHLNGAQSLFGVKSDLTTWGKGIANGFPLSALTGKKDIMRLGDTVNQDNRTFLLSTTHGGEAASLVSMMATVEEFVKKDAIFHNYNTGKALKDALIEEIERFGLKSYIKPIGYDCFWSIIFLNSTGEQCYQFRTLFMQELISNKVLFRGIFYPTISHGENEIRLTKLAFNNACRIYKKALIEGVDQYLVGHKVERILKKQ